MDGQRPLAAVCRRRRGWWPRLPSWRVRMAIRRIRTWPVGARPATPWPTHPPIANTDLTRG